MLKIKEVIELTLSLGGTSALDTVDTPSKIRIHIEQRIVRSLRASVLAAKSAGKGQIETFGAISVYPVTGLDHDLLDKDGKPWDGSGTDTMMPEETIKVMADEAGLEFRVIPRYMDGCVKTDRVPYEKFERKRRGKNGKSRKER